MIGRREIDRAAEEALAAGGGDWGQGLISLGFDLRAVAEYSERAIAAFEAAGLDPDAATRAGFRLGLQLGYRIGADQRMRARRPRP